MTNNTNYDVQVCVNDKPIKTYLHNGKFFVEARNNQEYTVKVKNNSWSRILVVPSIDGINVLSGEPAGKSKEGYVVSGYSNVEIKGWRTSHEIVHPFKFSSKSKSYAAKSEQTEGDTRNCGVIGIEVYAEKIKPAPAPIIIEKYIDRPYPVYPKPVWPNYPSYPYIGDVTWSSTTSSSNDAVQMRCLNNVSDLGSPKMSYTCNLVSQTQSDSDGCVTTDFDMGTEFSKNEVLDKVTEVEFETGLLLTTFEIYYASRTSLEDMGVEFVKQTKVSFPSAFPSKFCKPPR